MKGRVAGVVALAVFLAVPLTAQAGWVVQVRNTVINSKGERQTPEESTMYISGGKVRVVQPGSTTIIDYNKGRFSLINQNKELFWTGSIDEYVAEMSRGRQDAAHAKFGNTSAAQMARDPGKDDTKLPPFVLRKLGDGETIAGHPTVKYQMESNGQLFQELWVANDVDLSADLDPAKFIDVQEKLSNGMIGKAGKDFRAMWKNPDVRALHQKGFIVQNIVRHVAGAFERTTTSIQSSTIAANEFEVPDSYRRVKLSDVLKGDDSKS